MALASPVALVVVLLPAIAVRSLIATKIDAPQVPCDEFIYAEVARNVAEHGSYAFRGTHTLVSLLYPTLIAPAWIARSMRATYAIAKSINVVVMTLTAVPVYLWTRRLAGPAWAVGAAAVTLLMPDFHYTVLLMTEAVFLPAFVLATYLIALALERPTVRRQLWAVIAILVAVGVRLEGVALVPVLPSAIVIIAALEAWISPPGTRRRTLRRRLVEFWPTFAMLAALATAYLVAVAITGSRAPGFGFYEPNTTKHYVLGDVLRSALANLAGLTLLAGIVPLSALIVLVGLVRRSSASVRIFTTVTVVAAFWLLLEVGAIKGGDAYERYIFYLIPLLVIALFTWIGAGLPRPLVWTIVAMVVPAYLVFHVSDVLYSIASVPNYFGFFVFYRFALSSVAPGPGVVHWWVVAFAVVSAVFFALVVRPIAAFVIPAAIAAFFLAASIPPFGLLREQAYGSRYAPSVGRDADWIDEKIGVDANATFLYTPAAYPFETSLTMLETQFWNSSVRSIASVGGHEVCAIPEDGQTIRADGAIVSEQTNKPFRPQYVVTNPALQLDGDVLARRPSLTLYRSHSALRMISTVEDVFRDGWTGPWAAYTRYPAPGAVPRQIEIVLSRVAARNLPDAPSAALVQLWTGTSGGNAKPRVSQTRTIHMGKRLVFVLRTPRPPFHLEVHFAQPFSPSQFGQPDARLLGAQLRLELLPRTVRASTPAPPGMP